MKPINQRTTGSPSSLSSRVIAKVNEGVREEVTRHARKRGLYVKLSSFQRCEIVKYAGQHDAAESARHFFEEAQETHEREHRKVHK